MIQIGKLVTFKALDKSVVYFKVIKKFGMVYHCKCIKTNSIFYYVDGIYSIYEPTLKEISEEQYNKIVVFE